MPKRSIILLITTCFLIGMFSVGTHSQTRSPNGVPPQDAESIKKMFDERREESAKRREELRRRPRSTVDRRRKTETSNVSRAESISPNEKAAIGASEAQWKVIKPKLERVKLLRSRAGVHPRLTGSSSSGSGSGNRARIQWSREWENRDPSELTEGQKLVDKILRRLEAPSAKAEEFRELMDGLRKYRRRYSEQVPQAREELQKGLTVRQEAALVLMRIL